MPTLTLIYTLLAIGAAAIGIIGYLTRGAAAVAKRKVTAAEEQIVELQRANTNRKTLLDSQQETIEAQGKTIKEQAAKIETLEDKVKRLEQRVNDLLQRLGEQALARPAPRRPRKPITP